MINKAGGKQNWDKLSKVEQNERKSNMFTQLTLDLEKEEFENLLAQEKAMLKLFVQVGCGCNKDLNTMLSSYIALSKFWTENDLTPPILLPNKQNAAII